MFISPRYTTLTPRGSSVPAVREVGSRQTTGLRGVEVNTLCIVIVVVVVVVVVVVI